MIGVKGIYYRTKNNGYTHTLPNRSNFHRCILEERVYTFMDVHMNIEL